MNAYELAEKLYLSSMDTYHEEAANMLRQQADRIAELEKWEERWSKRCQRQQDELAELEGKVSHLKHINKNWSISEGLALQRIAELEKKLQESAMNYISICSQADEHYAMVQKLKQI